MSITTSSRSASQVGEIRSGHCPLCGGDSRAKLKIDDMSIRGCDSCDHYFFLPSNRSKHIPNVYGDDYFYGGNAGYEDYELEADLLVRSGKRYAKIVEPHGTTGCLLDIGAAAGYLLEGFQSAGWKGIGVEPNHSMVQLGNQRGINIVHSAFEEFSCDRRFQMVTMIQVIAHILDPLQAIEKVRSLLAPHGLVLIETWDRRSWTARLFGKRWHEYSPPSVVQWFSRRGLDEMMSTSGFAKVKRGRPSKWIKLGHASSLIRYKMSNSRLGSIAAAPLALMPKHLKVPYFLDDVFWSLYQRQD